MNNNLKFSFGIVSSPESSENLNKIINSIRQQNIPQYEIIIVGSIDEEFGSDTKVIKFDESVRSGWITKKKNLITSNSQFENIVYMHDYVYLDKDWYKGYLKFGNQFEVVINKILNFDNTRYHDWLICKNNDEVFDNFLLQSKQYMLPYFVKFLTEYMYISGTYWVAKKEFMTQYPLDEDLAWGQSEDIEWSKIVRDKTIFKFNSHSKVRFLKQKNIKWQKMKLRTLIFIIYCVYFKNK